MKEKDYNRNYPLLKAIINNYIKKTELLLNKKIEKKKKYPLLAAIIIIITYNKLIIKLLTEYLNKNIIILELNGKDIKRNKSHDLFLFKVHLNINIFSKNWLKL